MLIALCVDITVALSRVILKAEGIGFYLTACRILLYLYDIRLILDLGEIILYFGCILSGSNTFIGTDIVNDFSLVILLGKLTASSGVLSKFKRILLKIALGGSSKLFGCSFLTVRDVDYLFILTSLLRLLAIDNVFYVTVPARLRLILIKLEYNLAAIDCSVSLLRELGKFKRVLLKLARSGSSRLLGLGLVFICFVVYVIRIGSLCLVLVGYVIYFLVIAL